MSLNWNISAIEDYEELYQDTPDGKQLDGITQSFIWQSMVTGLGKGWTLDADFAPEFYARFKLLEKLNGPMSYRPDGAGGIEHVFVTIEDVQRRIGLHVNVSPVSRTAFLKNAVAVDLDRDARRFTSKVTIPEA